MARKLNTSTVKGLLPEGSEDQVNDSVLPGFHRRVLPSGHRTFGLAYHHAKGVGRRYRIGHFGVLTVHEARERARTKYLQLLDDLDVREKSKERAAMPMVGEFVRSLYAEGVGANLRDGVKTLARIECTLTCLLDRPLDSVGPWDIEAARGRRLKKGISKLTINRDVGSVKAMFRCAADWSVLASHPIASVKRFRIDTRKPIRLITADERERLEAALTLYCGLRVREILSLRWRDLNFRRRVVIIVGATSKSSQSRVVPMHGQVFDTLKSCKRE